MFVLFADTVGRKGKRIANKLSWRNKISREAPHALMRSSRKTWKAIQRGYTKLADQTAAKPQGIHEMILRFDSSSRLLLELGDCRRTFRYREYFRCRVKGREQPAISMKHQYAATRPQFVEACCSSNPFRRGIIMSIANSLADDLMIV